MRPPGTVDAARRVEFDEIWSFCYAKQKKVPDEYVDTPATATCGPGSRSMPTPSSFLVARRRAHDQDCYTFVADLRSRIKPGHRIQVTTDGLGLYPPVIESSLLRDRVDYAVMQKEYGSPPADEARRYSPATCTGIDVRVITVDPDARLVSTSYVERQNLTMWMGMRRFTRLTNAFSEKVENHANAVSLHFMQYNFARPHQSLGKATPALAAGSPGTSPRSLNCWTKTRERGPTDSHLRVARGG